jgi:hypothetical protein
MNVNSNGPNAPRTSDRYREAMDSFVQRTRNRLAHAKHLASRLAEVRHDQAAAERELQNTARRADTVEISNLDVPEVGRDVTNDELVRPKIARLKHLYRTGQLFKPGMLERAARGLLEHRHEVPNTETRPPNTGSGPVQPGASSEPTAPKLPNTGSGPVQPGASSEPTAPKPNTESGPSLPPASSLPTKPKAPPAPPPPQVPPASGAKLFMKPVSIEHFLNVEPAGGPNTADAPNPPGGGNPGSGGPNL